MKILYISSHYNPFEYNTGSAQRYNLLLRACAEIAEVDVVTFQKNVVSDIPNCKVIYSEESALPEVGGRLYRLKRLLRPWNPYSFFHKDKNRSAVIESILKTNEYDFIVTRYIPRALECGLLQYIDKLVIDVDDHPIDVMLTYSKNAKTSRARKYYKFLSKWMQYSINKILKEAHYSFFPNANQVYAHHSAYLPNIPYFETDALPYTLTNNHTLLFIGDLRYEPNIIGVEHFVENIFPMIRKRVPNARLLVAGRYRDEDWRKKIEQHDNIEVLGFVKELVPVYERSQVCVVPIYSGAGTNIKVLEALQMGRACVVSEEGTRGFTSNLKNGRDYYVASDDQEFANHVINLLTDGDLCKVIANGGADTVRKYYSRTYFNSIVKKALYDE